MNFLGIIVSYLYIGLVIVVAKLFESKFNFQDVYDKMYLKSIEDINYIDSKNSEQSLVHKLTVISNCKEMIQYNANLSLLMDKFIIEYVGGELV